MRKHHAVIHRLLLLLTLHYIKCLHLLLVIAALFNDGALALVWLVIVDVAESRVNDLLPANVLIQVLRRLQ